MNKTSTSDTIVSLKYEKKDAINKNKGLLRRNSIAASVLLNIGNVTEDIIVGMRYPHMAAYHGMESVYEFIEWEQRSSQLEALKRLEKKKLISIRKTGNSFMVRLLDIGAIEYFRQKVLNAERLKPNQYCLVVFDIPESERKVRQQLRRLLSSASFFPIQKSVWASQFNAAQELVDYLSVKGGRKWVRVFISDEVKNKHK
ncbi:CRISPR-associated endonuclease Cas2 [Patescibacteria group bacterium]|nr:CRISPR-associated endonuclease Cas2 [Patescibacteria group bacterium]MCG2687479.1 CRISPR-associated endonuclease Cas2 [Candidatus Parcubacteria bacterium]